MKLLKIFLYVSCGVLLIVLISRLEIVRIFFNDDILKICERSGGYSDSTIKNSTVYQPDKNGAYSSIYNGIYELEFCAVGESHDNSEYLVKLKDAKTKKTYKRMLGEFESWPRVWAPTHIFFGVGEYSACFKLPPNNDPNKKKLEELFKDKIKAYGNAQIDCL